MAGQNQLTPLAAPTGGHFLTSLGDGVAVGESLLAKRALALLGIGSGMACVVRYLDVRWNMGLSEWMVERWPLLVTVPALFLGASCFSRYGGFAKSWGLILFALWMAASFLWVDSTEAGRSLLIVVSFGVTLPLASLINRTRNQRPFALWLGLGYAAGMIAVIFSGPQHVGRFGCFLVNGTRLMDSNELGCFSVVIAVLMYGLLATRPARTGKGLPPPCEPVWIPLGIALLAITVALLTISRTAGVALAAAMLLIWFKHVSKRSGLAAVTPLLAASGLVAFLGLGVADDWADRVTDADVRTLNGRTDIWDGVWAVSRRVDGTAIRGIGCAGIDKVLGEELGEGRIHPVDGIRRRHSHNLYLEWLVELGLIGSALAVWVGCSAVRAGWRQDRLEGSIQRTTLFVSLAIMSLAGVPTKWAAFPGLGALLWAMLQPQRVTPGDRC